MTKNSSTSVHLVSPSPPVLRFIHVASPVQPVKQHGVLPVTLMIRFKMPVMVVKMTMAMMTMTGKMMTSHSYKMASSVQPVELHGVLPDHDDSL